MIHKTHYLSCYDFDRLSYVLNTLDYEPPKDHYVMNVVAQYSSRFGSEQAVQDVIEYALVNSLSDLREHCHTLDEILNPRELIL